MFNDYLDKAMNYAQYEHIEDDTYFGKIPGFQGVWSNAQKKQECKNELREVLEGWILLNIAAHTPLPVVDGMTLEVGKPV
jgi:predicted RNase H-like HicB family nuclease